MTAATVYESASTLRGLATAGQLAPLLFFGTVTILGMQEPGYQPLRETISQMGTRAATNAPLLNAALITTGILLVAFSGALHRAVEGRRMALAAGALMALTGLGMVGVGALPTDPCCPRLDERTFTAQAHFWVALTSFLAGTATAAMVGMAGLRRPWGGRGYRAYSMGTAAVALVLLALLGLADPEGGITPLNQWTGAIQRVFIATWMLWIEVTAVRLEGGLPST